MHRFLHACPAPSSRKPASGEQDSRFSAEKLGPRQETLQPGLRAAPHVAALDLPSQAHPHMAGLGHQPLGRAGSAGQAGLRGPVASSSRPRWCRLTHGAPGGGLARSGRPGPPRWSPQPEAGPASEGEDLCPENWGRDRQGDPGAPRGRPENQGDGAMAGRLWQGLGGSASFPTSPHLSHTSCDTSHSSVTHSTAV